MIIAVLELYVLMFLTIRSKFVKTVVN